MQLNLYKFILLLFPFLFLPSQVLSQPTVVIGNNGPTINVGLGASSAKYATLAAAVTDFGSTVGTLIINTASFSPGSSPTVPSTMTLKFENAGTLSCGSTTVTIQSSIANWPIRQIFDSDCSSTGSVDISTSKGSNIIYPQWWGAIVGDSVDDITAINAAANAGGVSAHIFFPQGIYDVSTAILYQNYQVFECVGPGGEALNTGTVIRTTSGGTKTIFAAKNAGSAQTVQPSIVNCGLQITAAAHIGIDLSRVTDAEIRNNKLRGSNSTGTGILVDSNPSSGLGNKIVDNVFYLLDRGVVLRQDANANLIQGNKFLTNTLYGVSVQGVCSGGTCTATDSCEAVGDCSGCSGTACSSNVTGVNLGNRIMNNWIEGSGTNNILDFGKGTIIQGNYIEITTGGTSAVNLSGADTTVVNNFCQQTTSKKCFIINGVSGAGGFRITLRDNVCKGAGNCIEEITAGTAIEVGRQLYESNTNKVTTVASSGIRWIDLTEGITQGTLPTNIGNGSLLNCTDCTADADCAPSGSTGGFAKRVNGSWVCN